MLISQNMIQGLVKDTFIYGATDFICKFINFAIFPILAYVLTVAEFGIYTLLTVQSWFMIMLINCGMYRSLERFYLDKEATQVEKDKVVCSGLVGLFLLSVIVILPSVILTFAYREAFQAETHIQWHLFVLAILTAFPTALLHFTCHVFRLDFSPWRFCLFHASQNLLALGIGFYLVFVLKWGVDGLLWGAFASFVLVTPLAIALLFQQHAWRIDWKLVLQLVAFGCPFMFTDIARWIYGLMDRWLLDGMATVVEVGLFSMAFKLSTVMIFLMNAFGLAWTPYALKAHNEDPNHKELYSRCFTWWFALLTFISLCLNLFGKECLMLLTPPAYWPSATLLPFITTGLSLFGTTVVTGMGFFITKKTFHIALSAWLGAGINCVLNVCLIPHYGAQGSAFATLITYGMLASYYLGVSQKLYPVPLEQKKLWLCLSVLLLGAVLPFLGLHISIKVIFLGLVLALFSKSGIIDLSLLKFPKKAVAQ